MSKVLVAVLVVATFVGGWLLGREPNCLDTSEGRYCLPTKASSVMVFQTEISATAFAKNGWYGHQFNALTFGAITGKGWEVVEVRPWISGARMDAHSRLLMERFDRQMVDIDARHKRLFISPSEEEAEYQAEEACRLTRRAAREWGGS